MWVVDINNLS